MPIINFEFSPWFIPLCILIGGGLTLLLYSKDSPWSKWVNILLACARFILFTLLSVLLLNPLFTQFVNDIEDPKVIIAVDNSQSMKNGADSAQLNQLLGKIANLQNELIARDYKVEVQTLTGVDESVTDIEFGGETTNLHAWLSDLQSRYENTNLARIYLISDGKYNQGISPAYFPYRFELNTIGIGDTTQQEDLILNNVLYNQVAYQGNRYPVIAEVINFGFEGRQSEVSIWQNGKKVDSKTVRFNKKNKLQRIEMEVNADENGFQRLKVIVNPLNSESISVNNRRNIFVDVIEGKQKILIIAPAPHPDIKALTASMSSNQNFEFTVFIPKLNEYVDKKYDLAIVHQTYDRWNKTKKYVEALKQKDVPVFHILGKTSVLKSFNQNEQHLFINQHRNQKDNVGGAINQAFNKFSISDVSQQTLSSYPPLTVPFGEYGLSASADVLLYQKVGSVHTTKPLLFVVEENDTKTGFMMADDFWKWRMQEYALSEDTKIFDAIFSKTIQYLSTKVDKRKFRFYPVKNEYFSNESVQFQAELYNEIYERVYGQEVKVKISSKEGLYQEASFIPASSYSNLELTVFDEGTYTYSATVKLNDKTETVKGAFVIKKMQLEAIDQVADFGLLRRLADNSNGSFYKNEQFDDVLSDLDLYDDKGIIHTHEDILSMINLTWLLYILMLIATVEWFARKYNGGY